MTDNEKAAIETLSRLEDSLRRQLENLEEMQNLLKQFAERYQSNG